MTSIVLWQKLIVLYKYCWLITVCDVIKKYFSISQIQPYPGYRNLPSPRDLHYLKYLLRHQYKAIDFLKKILYYILFIKITYLLWIEKTVKTVRVIFYFSLQKTFLIYLLWRFLSFFLHFDSISSNVSDYASTINLVMIEQQMTWSQCK